MTNTERLATHPGRCARCRADIHTGDPIAFVSRGRARVAVHAACRDAEMAERLAQSRPVTPRTVRANRGTPAAALLGYGYGAPWPPLPPRSK